MKYVIGVDSGSTMCKAALLVEGKLLDWCITETTWDPRASALRCVDLLLKRQGILHKDVHFVATGYGREALDFAHSTLTEISAHAKGGVFLNPTIQGIIDIGGQDSKVIRISKGKPVSFQMNDKCAAGTGRFLEMACAKLGIPMEEIDLYSTQEEAALINSMCAVFAESEIIGHLAKKTPRAQILRGVIISVANKVNSLTGKAGCAQGDLFLMTGGLAKSKTVVEEIQSLLASPVVTHSNSQLAGAIGAALTVIN